LGDGERYGRPSTAVHDENVAKVRALLLEQPHLTLRTIAEELVRRVHRIRPEEYRDLGSWTLLHDNAPAHTATLLTRYYAKNLIAVLSRYSPDMVSAEYFPFPKFRLKMEGHFFNDSPATQRACTDQLKVMSQNDFSRVFEQLYGRCKECMTRQGGSV